MIFCLLAILKNNYIAFVSKGKIMQIQLIQECFKKSKKKEAFFVKVMLGEHAGKFKKSIAF